MSATRHEQYMQQALVQACQAQALGEVPIGAVLVYDDKVITVAKNTPISDSDPSAHAEINVLRQAAKKIGNYRLLNTTLYVTLEPCAMCAAAMIHARIQRLIYACDDPKSGAVTSHLQLFAQPMLNHRVYWQSGVLAAEASMLLKNFFKQKRVPLTWQ